MSIGITSGNETTMVAIYARLSVNENGERDESLETQRDLLVGYVLENGWRCYKVYVDNDMSGVYFDRPGLMELINDINNGIIKIAVVKDLSRLGRNNGETLTFLDFLAEKNVRLIALADNYDSFRDDDEIIGIRTWVNEHYARDISKKVRYNLKKKMQKGEHLGRPHFGYRKSSTEKNKLVVDERYREIIRNIFELYVKGWGYRALANYVQSLGVPTPSQDKGYAKRPQSDRWNEQHIRRIITSRVYCGDSVQGVSEKISFKSRKTRRTASEKWIVVRDAHEAIVSRETWELAQRVRMKRWLKGGGRKRNTDSQPHLFTGFIACATCGTYHVYRKKQGRPAVYVCGKYNKYGRSGCTSHYVTEEKLVQHIIQDVQTMAEGVLFHHQLVEKYKKNASSIHGAVEKINKLEGEIAAKKNQLQAAYLDKIRGIISEELFLVTNSLLQKEIGLLAGRLSKLQADVANVQQVDQNIERINNMKPELLSAGDIDRVFLEKYVKKIIVLEEGEGISEKVAEKYGLDLVFSRDKLADMSRKRIRLVIHYNLLPEA
ncbi:recombinase family protein [Desulfoscipio geothermicus]|uniref:Site-specific DNA recombinase n=1 Tax=Desulfoscipio geothermicus DSM 3669 TaxID=1121426 RepID=A0A1I6DG11_9FIRM|nr:recombinase family protein [Desulfoscipio geothermicus]SFR04318.1 Site-specific DNA recombinase [Desulfoscipio geothermicus DSM 3669]